MKIRKIATSIGVVGKILNSKTTSDKDTYSCDYINEKSNYSTEEKVIGTWADGKPLYRIVVIGKTPTTEETWGNIGAVPSNISIKKMDGMIGGYLPAPSYINGSYYVALQSANNIIQAYVKGYLSASISVIIEYTKNTD